VLLLEEERTILYDLVDFKSHIGLRETPELLQELHTQQVFLQQELEDLVAALDELQMGFSLVKEDVKDSIRLHPLHQEFTREATRVNPVAFDNLVQIPDALDPPLHET
jgi:hypothetical protein